MNIRMQNVTVLSAILAAMLLAASPARAINIVLNYNNGASVEPAADPTGALLTGLFQHAESRYQDIFEDTHTLTINYWYENLAPGTLGAHSLVSQSGGRETEANIRIDNNSSWFIDATPANDSEFTMGQLLWRDLTATQQADLYNFGTNIPETFEVTYTGAATASGGASGLTDMLSVVLHETGHALGMSAANTSTVTETADGDYDFTPAFVFGRTLAVEHADGGNIAHLDASSSFLMDPSIGTSLRRRPSHTDLFAMAAGHNYLLLDVPRREFYGGQWTQSGAWSGNTVPASADDVYVRNHGGTDFVADLQGNGSANNVFISEGSDVDLNANTLSVFGDLFITDLGSLLTVNGGGTLNVSGDEIDIANSAVVQISAAAATIGTINAGIIDIAAGTDLRSSGAGTGVVNVSSLLSNDGILYSFGGGTLSIVGTGVDLDGTSGDGKVDANTGDIVVSATLSDTVMNGEFEVDPGRILTVSNAWTLGAGGLLDLNGGAAFADRAQMNGGTITINSVSSEVSVVGIADINANVVISDGLIDLLTTDDELNFDGSATISGGTFDAGPTGAQVDFNGATTFAGGTITSIGLWNQNGSAIVSTDTTVNADLFNLDGGGLVTWTVNKTLTLNADGVESVSTDNTFNGTLNINNPGFFVIGSSPGGNLAVNLPGTTEWTMAGTANLDGSVEGGPIATLIPSMISGSDVNISGTVNVVDRAAIGARTDFSGTANINGNTAELWFNGGSLTDPNTLLGGTITGTGKFQATDGRALHGRGTISAASIEFIGDTSELMAQGGTLTISSVIADVGVIGTEDATGVLNVTTAWTTANAFDVDINGGTVTGANISNPAGNSIHGFGTLSPNQVNNNGEITADTGGTLIINTGANPDLDGGSGAGVLNAVAGNLRVVDPVTDFFDGTANVGAGRFLAFDNGWTLGSSGATGTLNLNGGATLGTAARITGSTSDFRGTTNVKGIGRLFTTNLFVSGSTTNINGATSVLRLENDTTVQASATFAGTGTLLNTFGDTLTLLNGATVAVDLVNDGTIEIGASPGTARSGDFIQSSVGDLIIELQGLTPGRGYDQLIVSGDLALDGNVEIVVVNPPHTPVLGNEYRFMPYSGRRSGIFETVGGAALSGVFGMAVRYDFAGPGLVDVRMSIRGDTDFDNDVDTADLTNTIIGFSGAGNTGNSWVNGDFDGDGDTDTSDITQGIINFTGASAANPNVPDLIYDPATGNVTIDADGADVISFSLQSGPFSPADFSGLPAGLTDNIATQIGWTCFNLFSGLTGNADLGNILPAGLNQAALEAALTTASYGLALSGGGGGGRLDIIIPEPTAILLMGLGAVALMRRRVR